MRGFIIAMQFLTRLPLPKVRVESGDFARSMRWFPAAGLVIGVMIAGAAWAGALANPWLAALAALLVWVLVTGALHLDGLADLADACGAGHTAKGDRERFLAVMADPHVGSFGVVAIVLQLLAKLVLLFCIAQAGDFAALVAVPFAARIGPLVWTRWLPPLHAGLASRFAGVIGARHIVLWGLCLAAVAVAAPAMLAAPVLIGLWGFWLKHRVGGVSGDCHGAGIELVETGLLVVLSLLAETAGGAMG